MQRRDRAHVALSVFSAVVGAAVMAMAPIESTLASRIPTDHAMVADSRPSAPSEAQRTTRPESGSRPPGPSDRRDTRPANPPTTTGAPQPTTEAAKPSPPSAPTPPQTGMSTRPTPPPSIGEAHHDDHGPRPTPPAGATMPPRPSVQPASTPRTDDDRTSRPTLTPGETPQARPTLPPGATRHPEDTPPLRAPHRVGGDDLPPGSTPISEHPPVAFVPGPDPLVIPPHQETPFVTTGTLATGTFVAIQLQGTPGHELRVEASGFDTTIEVATADGTVIATDDNGLGDALGGSTLTFVIPADGLATVTVRGVGDASGDYRMVVTPTHHGADPPEPPTE